jgi:hypothetical protein
MFISASICDDRVASAALGIGLSVYEGALTFIAQTCDAERCGRRCDVHTKAK